MSSGDGFNITGKKRKRKNFTKDEDVSIFEYLYDTKQFSVKNINWGQVEKELTIDRTKSQIQNRFNRIKRTWEEKRETYENAPKVVNYFKSLIDDENPTKRVRVMEKKVSNQGSSSSGITPSRTVKRKRQTKLNFGKKNKQGGVKIKPSTPTPSTIQVVKPSVKEAPQVLDLQLPEPQARRRVFDQDAIMKLLREKYSNKRMRKMNTLHQQQQMYGRLKKSQFGKVVRVELKELSDEDKQRTMIGADQFAVQRERIICSGRGTLVIQEKLEELEYRKTRVLLEREKKKEQRKSARSKYLSSVLKDAKKEEKKKCLMVQEGIRKRGSVAKAIRVAESERDSKYSQFPLLNKRYMLVELLGKGGFSEVWKGVDIQTNSKVSVKIHEVNQKWSEDRKVSFVKHVLRECRIIKTLSHHHFVGMKDYFILNKTVLCTVLEYFKGEDLDVFIKKQLTPIPEERALYILRQLIDALSILFAKKIIHYDLKPSNILINRYGDIKITDFGLSKTFVDDESILQTTPGAGTYYFLPPECFQKGVKISAKVDIWAIGIIYYQILFRGKLPYDQNYFMGAVQFDVNFPTDKEFKASVEAKRFIRACLIRDKEKRPNIEQIKANFKEYLGL